MIQEAYQEFNSDKKRLTRKVLLDDLIKYYKKLYKTEQLKLSLVNEYKWFKNDIVFYEYKLSTIKENTIIRTLKKETMNVVKKYFYN